MDRQNRPHGGKKWMAAFCGFKPDGNESKKPIVPVQNLGLPSNCGKQIQCGTAEKSKTLDVLSMPRVDAAFPIQNFSSMEVDGGAVKPTVLKEINRNGGFRDGCEKNVDAFSTSAKKNLIRGQTMNRARVGNGSVKREDDSSIHAEAVKRGRKRAQHIPQPSGFCQRG